MTKKVKDTEIVSKPKKRKRSKFGVDITETGKLKRTYKEIVYDSEMEMKFFKEWIEPKMLSGEIIKCERQVEYTLQDKCIHQGKNILPIKYKSDFNVTLTNGHLIVYDVKGKADNTALLKRKMFWCRYPDIDYQWICKSEIDGGWLDYDVVKTFRMIRKKEKAILKESKTPPVAH